MPRRRDARAWTLALAALVPALAEAHSFGRIYNLPVPLWLYLYGAAAALLLSFVAAGVVLAAPAPALPVTARARRDGSLIRGLRRLRPALQALSVLLLLLCIATGLFGSRDPYRNFNMTFFWVVFVLGLAYASVVVGNVYAWLNPWRVLAQQLDRLFPGYARGRYAWPQRLAYWPALLLYMGFIWIELFAHTRPWSLGVLLLAYTVLNLVAVGLVGAAAWFRYGELFSVLLQLLSLMAPVDAERRRLRAPFSGLLAQRAGDFSLLLFVLFMLSSTAFDGLRATLPWFKLFWTDSTGWISAWIGKPPLLAYVQLRPWYLLYETLCLLLSPFLYLAAYLLFIALARAITRSPHSLRELALAFAYTLLPIALVYHLTHYYTLLLTQGVKIVSLASDPFGRGWNLFGTAGLLRAPILPAMGTVWHTQVGLILFGHVVSVWLAHREALRLFPTRRQALLSQLPMLLLMVLFTIAGLWILAQPLQPGR